MSDSGPLFYVACSWNPLLQQKDNRKNCYAQDFDAMAAVDAAADALVVDWMANVDLLFADEADSVALVAGAVLLSDVSRFLQFPQEAQ